MLKFLHQNGRDKIFTMWIDQMPCNRKIFNNQTEMREVIKKINTKRESQWCDEIFSNSQPKMKAILCDQIATAQREQLWPLKFIAHNISRHICQRRQNGHFTFCGKWKKGNLVEELIASITQKP